MGQGAPGQRPQSPACCSHYAPACLEQRAPRCFFAPIKCFDCQASGNFAESNSVIVSVDPGALTSAILEEDSSTQEFLRLRALVRTGGHRGACSPSPPQSWSATLGIREAAAAGCGVRDGGERCPRDGSSRLPADLVFQDESPELSATALAAAQLAHVLEPISGQNSDRSGGERIRMGEGSVFAHPFVAVAHEPLLENLVPPWRSDGLAVPHRSPARSEDAETLSSEDTELRDFGLPPATPVPAPPGITRLDLGPVIEATAAKLAASELKRSDAHGVIAVCDQEAALAARRPCSVEWWLGGCISQRCMRHPVGSELPRLTSDL